MSVGSINGAASLIGETAQTDRNPYADMSSGDFVKIMLEELSNQDPFDPQDSTAILEQLSSIRNIESDLVMQNRLDSMVTQNSIAAAAGMIGKFVKGLNASNDTVEGVVVSMRIEDDKPILALDSGEEIDGDRVTGVDNLTDGDTAIMQQLLLNLQMLDSSSLVGKQVVAVDENNLRQEGRVDRVLLDAQEIYLELSSGATVPISNVRSFGQGDE